MRTGIRLAAAAAAFSLCLPAFAGEVAVLRNGFSIHHARHEVMGSFTRLYLDGGKKSFVDVPTNEIESFERDAPPAAPPAVQTAVADSVPAASSADIKEVVANASGKQNLDPDFVNSVIHAESGFNPHAVSRKGAQGLMQLMPQTANNLGVKDAFNPQANVEAGTKYLRELLERYNFNIAKALAAYNAGPGRVDRYKGVPPYFETQAYIARIIRDFNRKKAAEQQAAKRIAAAQRAAAQNHKPPKSNSLSHLAPAAASVISAVPVSAGHQAAAR